MLVREPRVGIVRLDGEVSIPAEAPKNLPAALAVCVVDLDHPILMPDGHYQVAVGGVAHGVGVQPVVGLGAQVERRASSAARHARLTLQGGARRVDVVESIPCPLHLEIPVEHHHRLAKNIHRTGTLHAGQNPFGSRQHDDAAVRQRVGFVMKSRDRRLAHGRELLTHPRGVGFTDRSADQIEFADHLVGGSQMTSAGRYRGLSRRPAAG